MLRVLGLKPEKTYGNLENGVINPDFHRELDSGSFKLNDEVITKNSGSRTVQLARAGIIAPTGESEGSSDLKRIGHFLYGALDQYKYYEQANSFDKFKDLSDEYHIHEFWGGEEQFLHSFGGWVTIDLFMKRLYGLLLNSLKLEVSDEFMTQSEEWVYKTEKTIDLDQSEYEKIIPCGVIPIMSYDVQCRLGEAVKTGNDTHTFRSLSFELNNNINTDNLTALGSRFPKRQASAQNREISVELTGNLTKEDIDLIRGAEYGDTKLISPSECKIFKCPVQFVINICEKREETLIVTLPSCTVNVEYDLSESDEIETTFTLTSLGSKKTELLNGENKFTDIHCILVNDIPMISSEPSSKDTRSLITDALTVNGKDGELGGANVRLIGLTDSLEYETITNDDGFVQIDYFKAGQKYKIEISHKDYDKYEKVFDYPDTFEDTVTLNERSEFDIILIIDDGIDKVENAEVTVTEKETGKSIINDDTDCRGQILLSKLKKGIVYVLKIVKGGLADITEEITPTKDEIIKRTMTEDRLLFTVRTESDKYSGSWSGTRVGFYEGDVSKPIEEAHLIEYATSKPTREATGSGDEAIISNYDLEQVLSKSKSYFIAGTNSFINKTTSNYKKALTEGKTSYSPTWYRGGWKGVLHGFDLAEVEEKEYKVQLCHNEIPLPPMDVIVDFTTGAFTMESTSRCGGANYMRVFDATNNVVIARSNLLDLTDKELEYDFTKQ